MSTIVAPEDAVRVALTDVTQLDDDSVYQPVTSGLTGTVTIQQWDDEDAIVDGPTAITLLSGSTWYLDLAAPEDEGHYRVVAVAIVNGAQRTFAGELTVERPVT